MADKPHRDHPRTGTPTGDVLPSWQRATEPESRWPAFAAVLIAADARLISGMPMSRGMRFGGWLTAGVMGAAAVSFFALLFV